MKRIVLVATAALALFLALMGLELVQDTDPFSLTSFSVDLLGTGLLVLTVASTLLIAIEIREFRQQRTDLLADLTKARIDGDRWRTAARIHVEGLGRAIQEQFARWGLTNSETEIAMLMLKGLSHKEVARIRQSGETTVRQQARAIYRKSSLASRAELAAYFLEDLLPPLEQRGGPTVALFEAKK